MNASLCSLMIAAVLATSVNAHGQMTSPTYRPVTDKFRADSGTLKYAGEQELQYAPVENLSERKQADQPQAATFDMMNGCRGMVYEAGGPVTALKPGQELPVKWIIQAPHPGFAEFSIVKAKTGAGGKIMYEKAVMLKRIEDFAKSGGEGGDTVTIPSNITGCEKAGDCALQMYWHSDIANQTYPTCADITISGSGASTPAASGDDESDAGSDATEAPAASADDSEAGSDATEAPAAADESASADGEADVTPVPAADDGYATDAPTPAPSAAAGGDDEYATPAPTKKKCTAKARSLRRN